MSDFRLKELIAEAKESVTSASYSPKKLALIHTGVAAGVSLVVALLTYFLDIGIGNTGGLSGMGTRAVLETAQSVLQLLLNVLSPFWALGFIAAALGLARRQQTTPHTLMTGLRRWGPALRMLILQGLIYFVVAFVAIQVGSIIYTMTPASQELDALVEDLLAAGTTDADALTALLEGLDDATLMNILLGMLPYLLIPMALLLIPVVYRLRLAQYVLMDQPQFGALHAIMQSFRLTKGNCLKLFKLDIRYCWYYILEALVIVLSMGDLILPAFGVPLNMSTVTASIVFYVLALLTQLALYAWKKPQIYTTYALFYDRLLPQQQSEA